MYFKYKLRKIINDKKGRNKLLSLGLQGLLLVIFYPFIILIAKIFANIRGLKVEFKYILPLSLVSTTLYIIFFNIQWYYSLLIIIGIYLLINITIFFETAISSKLTIDEIRDAKLGKLLRK